MLSAIEFDRQLEPGTGEIDDVAADRVLPAKASSLGSSRKARQSCFSTSVASRRNRRAMCVRFLSRIDALYLTPSPR